MFSKKKVFFAASIAASGFLYYDKKTQIRIESAVRFATTTWYVSKCFWEYKTLAAKKKNLTKEEYDEERKNVHKRGAEFLLKLCLINQGSFLKAGQHLASLSYALPQQYTDSFSVLQDKAPTHTYKETRAIIKEQFGKELEEIFDNFSAEPIASASIAQVHSAFVNGQKVAVKIQHPKVEKLFESDLYAMKLYVNLAEKLFDFTLGWILPEFREIVKNELNFLNEGTNCEKFREMFRYYKNITAPNIYWNSSSKKVLTMEFIDGFKVNDVQSFKRVGISEKQVSKLLTDCYSIQTFLYGFIHSDCHPGNLMVIHDPEENQTKLVVLDHGCYQNLDEQTRMDYSNLWKALVFRDNENLKIYSKRFGIEERFSDFMGLIMTLSDTFNSSNGGVVDERKVYSPEEKKNFQQSLNQRFGEELGSEGTVWDLVQKMFAHGKRELVLLLRVNSLLQNIHRELGKPINRYEVMAKYAIMGLNYETEERMKRGLKLKVLKSTTISDKIKLGFILFYFNIYVVFAKVYYLFAKRLFY